MVVGVGIVKGSEHDFRSVAFDEVRDFMATREFVNITQYRSKTNERTNRH